MAKEKKKRFIVPAAIILGMGALTPSYAVVAAESTESQVQIGQMIQGVVIEHSDEEIIVKGDDGKRYHVGLHSFDGEKIQSMNISLNDSVQIEGEVLESYSDLYDFAYFAKSLPVGITEDEMKELEHLYNRVMDMEKRELWDESSEVWTQIFEIINPYYDDEDWAPEPFDVFISMFDYSFTSEDLQQLEELYNQWITLVNSGAEEESSVKMDQFFEIINSYYVEPTFDEYLADAELTISEVDYPIIKQLYEEFHEALNGDDEELLLKKMEAFNVVIYPYYRAAHQLPTFEEQMSDFDFEVSEGDLSKLREIYAGILASEKTNDYEQEAKQWESFYAIIETYFIEEASIPFRATQIVINGETFDK